MRTFLTVFLTLLLQFLLAKTNLFESGDNPTTDTGCKGFFYTSQFNCSAGDTQFNFCQGFVNGALTPGFYNTSSHSCYVGSGGQQSILTGSDFNVLCRARDSKGKMGKVEAEGEFGEAPPKNTIIGGINKNHSAKLFVIVCSFSGDRIFDKPGKWDGGAHAVDGGVEKPCPRWQWVTCKK